MTCTRAASASRSSAGRRRRRSRECDLRGEVVFLLGAEREGLPAEVERDLDAWIPIAVGVAERRRRGRDRALRVAAPESLTRRIARINVTPVKALGLEHPRRSTDAAACGEPALLPRVRRAALQRQGSRAARAVVRGRRRTLELGSPTGARSRPRSARATVETDFWDGRCGATSSRAVVGGALRLRRRGVSSSRRLTRDGHRRPRRTLVGRASCDRLGEELGATSTLDASACSSRSCASPQ